MSETSGHISDMGVLDLTSAQSPDDLSGITAIEDVGVVLIPEHLMTALVRIPLQDVDNIVPVPQGSKVKLLAGQTRLAGEAFAGDDEETICIIVGQLFVITPVAQVRYKGLWIAGQLFAPRGSEGALGAKIVSLTGQVFYYPQGARFLTGDTPVSREYLELLPEPTPLVVVGTARVADDVSVDLLKSKVPEILLAGTIVAPASLVPLLQVLTVERIGTISARE